ncbi:MAG: hypothetical protein OXM55_05680 [Bdellovibrionales bacterium]|nr:hypothetical protein [Bdellovibrionales bacterium]
MFHVFMIIKNLLPLNRPALKIKKPVIPAKLVLAEAGSGHPVGYEVNDLLVNMS